MSASGIFLEATFAMEQLDGANPAHFARDIACLVQSPTFHDADLAPPTGSETVVLYIFCAFASSVRRVSKALAARYASACKVAEGKTAPAFLSAQSKKNAAAASRKKKSRKKSERKESMNGEDAEEATTSSQSTTAATATTTATSETSAPAKKKSSKKKKKKEKEEAKENERCKETSDGKAENEGNPSSSSSTPPEKDAASTAAPPAKKKVNASNDDDDHDDEENEQGGPPAEVVGKIMVKKTVFAGGFARDSVLQPVPLKKAPLFTWIPHEYKGTHNYGYLMHNKTGMFLTCTESRVGESSLVHVILLDKIAADEKDGDLSQLHQLFSTHPSRGIMTLVKQDKKHLKLKMATPTAQDTGDRLLGAALPVKVQGDRNRMTLCFFKPVGTDSGDTSNISSSSLA